MDNINVTIGGPKKSLVFTYKTVLLRNNMDLEDQLFEQDTKYIIKWNFDLGGKTITIPENCILSFDGGVISNGTIVGQNTYIDNVGGLDNILEGVTLEGTWRETVDDELSATSENPIKNKAVYEAIQGIRDEMNEKGYSDNNFSTEEKDKLQNLPTSDELNSALNNKVNAVPGKGLSLNDFTDTLKDKLDSIESNAQANVLADWNEADSNSDSFIKNKPTLLNLSVDDNVANNTNNPVSSKAVKEYVDGVATNLQDNINNKADASDLSRVAQTGSYNDLTDKPNIASELVQADWNENDTSDKSFIRNKPNLALVALSGSYDDLTNKPTIQGIPQSVIDMVEGGPYLTASDILNKADKTNATQSLAGLMSALDKEKLDNLTTDIEQALANKADKDYYATNEHGGLITAEEKRRLNTIPSRGYEDVVTKVRLNNTDNTPDSEGTVDLGEVVTVNPLTGKIPSNLLPEVNALGLGETSDKAFPGDRGKSLEDALEELNSGAENTNEVLEAIVALLWPDGELNAAIVTALKAILDNHESRIKALEGDVDPDYPRIDYTNKFSDLIATFNNTPPIRGDISTNPDSTIYKYLYAYYSDAETEWKKTSSPFFLRSNFQEIEGYNEIPGLKGTYKESYELAFDAMTAWLMAMCLSELKPSGYKNYSTDPTNNLTIFFETAYNYNGNGRSVLLYNNYDLHCDPMHARLIAGAIYARVRGKMSLDDVVAARSVLGGDTIKDEDIKTTAHTEAWDALGYMGFMMGSLKSDNVYLGYYVNSRKVIPNAPGPYVNGEANRYSKPWSQDLPEGQFYMSELDGNDWSLYNYVVDYLADAKVRENYLMMVEYSDNASVYNANLQKIKSLWGIDGTTTSTYSHEKRTTILNAAAAFFALSRYFFGSRNVHLNALTKGTQTWNGESAIDTDYYMFKFIEGSTGGDQDYTLGGPFADLENYMYSGKASTDMSNPIFTFLDQVREAGDNARWPTYIPEYGRRRRPLGAAHNGSDGENSRSTTFGSPLNGFNNYALRYYFAHSNNRGDNNHIGWPKDGALSYPSGHASLTMTTALMLGQLYAKTNEDKLLYYMKKSYSVGVGRMITRAHWLSDVIYGRLFATMTLPVLNATERIINNYDTVLSTLTGTTPVGVGSARVIKGSSGGEGGSSTIDVYVHNNGGSAILIARVTFTLEANSGDPNPNVNLEREAKYMFDPTTIPAGGAGVKVLSGVTISQFDYFNAVASNHNIIGFELLEYNTAYTSTYGTAYKSISGSSISQLSNIPFKNGMEYHIHFNGGTSTYSDNSSGGGGDGPGANKINVLIINKTGVDVQLENKIRFLIQNGTTVDRTDAIALGGTNPITIHANDVDGETFSNITLSAHDLNFIGRPFATSYNVEGRNYQSNIILYDPDDTNRSAPIMDASKYTFEDNATYEITLGGYTPPPSGKPTLELTIINTTLLDAIFSGEIRIYTTTESTADSAAQRLAEELLKKESICVDLPNCDVRKNRYKLAAGTSMTLTVNPYKAAGEGKSIEELINSVDNIKFLTGSENWTNNRTAPKIYVYATYMNDDANHTIQTTHHTGFVVGTYEPGNTYLQWNNTGTIRINTVVPSTNNIVNPGDGTYTYSTD